MQYTRFKFVTWRTITTHKGNHIFKPRKGWYVLQKGLKNKHNEKDDTCNHTVLVSAKSLDENLAFTSVEDN